MFGISSLYVEITLICLSIFSYWSMLDDIRIMTPFLWFNANLPPCYHLYSDIHLEHTFAISRYGIFDACDKTYIPLHLASIIVCAHYTRDILWEFGNRCPFCWIGVMALSLGVGLIGWIYVASLDREDYILIIGYIPILLNVSFKEKQRRLWPIFFKISGNLP